MGGNLDSIGLAEARSALAWWLDSGVDVALQEAPRNWLNPAPAPRHGPASATATDTQTQPPPDDLGLFRDWLASSPDVPLAQAGGRRVLPHGPEAAGVMLLADSPAGEDAAAGQPLGGDAWALARRMLAAIGFGPDEAYSASLSCMHAPGSRMSETDRQACAELARRHIRLAKPRRLLLLGDGPCLALLGTPLVQARGHVHKIEGVRAVATFHPRHLIKRPLDKSLAWRDLLLLMEDAS